MRSRANNGFCSMARGCTILGVMPTIAYRMLGEDLLLFMCGHASPSEHEWQDYLRTLDQAAQGVRQRGGLLRFLVFADDGTPNAKQRGTVVDAVRGLATRVAVITTSKLARHVITVFAWFGLSVRGFAPHQLDAALEYLELPQGQLSQIIDAARTLAPTIGGVSSFHDATARA